MLSETVVVLSMICDDVESLFPPPRATTAMTTTSIRPAVVPISTFRRLDLFCWVSASAIFSAGISEVVGD